MYLAFKLCRSVKDAVANAYKILWMPASTMLKIVFFIVNLRHAFKKKSNFKQISLDKYGGNTTNPHFF